MRVKLPYAKNALVKKIAGLLLLAAVLGFASATRAQQPSIRQVGPGIWAAGIPSNEFEFIAARQRHSKLVLGCLCANGA